MAIFTDESGTIIQDESGAGIEDEKITTTLGTSAAGTKARKPAPDQTTDSFLITDLSIFFDGVFAQAIQYLPSVGAATEIQAIINREAPYQEPYVRGEGIANCEIEVQVSTVASPNYGDRFQIASEMWEYDPARGVIEQDEYTLTIALERQI